MSQVPEPLVRRDQGFHGAPAISLDLARPAREHCFEDLEELLRHLKLLLVAGLVKSDQNLVSQATGITGGFAPNPNLNQLLKIFRHGLSKTSR
jgi:hypothetical protein